MTTRPWLAWLGWALLYALALWGLWLMAAHLALQADSPAASAGLWIVAVLLPLALALIGALGTEAMWWTAIPPLVIGCRSWRWPWRCGCILRRSRPR